ncbi:vigilin [Coccinella septempunctata]|uniref:vigilin n=1 Tax=Coccinella septempunctata TaxID=41139 RepID=UPI001D0943B5|nr:vigilin [Coccinella septempunctata]
MQQPVIEEGNVGYETPSVRSYDDLFPALPESTPVTGQNSLPASGWHQKTNKMRVGTSVITHVFRVPFEERKLDHSQKFGEGESIQTCANIMKDTGAHIEISHGKDQSLTFLVTGKPNEVSVARRKILVHFQTQASKQISIPKEHHGWILGKKGDRLKELEKQTATKISVPPQNDASDVITISGTKEGIEKAEHEIRITSDQQSKKAIERLNIPRMYHPFISGAYNENVNQLIAETGAKINIPPPSVMKDEIFIAGDKEGVAAAKARIEAIYKEMEKKCNTVSVEVPKEQHKYVVGPKGSTIAEILQTTGVSVEMPIGDSTTGTITLRGPQDKLGLALSKVYEKANSVKTCHVDAPAWLHKYIIGKKGQTIKEITQNMEKIHVEFTAEDKIRIQGPPEEVEKVQEQLDAMAKDLVKKMTYVEKHVDTKLFKHIIGKNGTNVNKLREEYNVTINIDESGLIRIEGNRDEVHKIDQELEEKINKLENEKEKDVIIPQRHYRSIIGVKGANIKDIRDRFNQVQITFPGPGERNEIVKVRGPKEDVDKCCRHLEKLVKELNESSYVVEVPVYKQFHKFIIGKDGVNIKKIREETQTKIDLPSEGDKSDAIVITGKKENVEKAEKMIRKIRDEHESIVEEEITILPKFYNSIIGTKGKLIKMIQEDCGNVTIKFPSPECKSDKVVISGLKGDVERAKQQLLERVNEKKASSFTEEIRAKPEHHKYLIGKDGCRIKKIRDSTGAKIEFPSNTDEDREVIRIIGKEESVKEAKKALEASIKELEDWVQTTITVDSKHHKHFVARKAEKLNQINEEYGVQTSFPRFGEVDDQVTLIGPKKAMDAAIARIREIISDLESMVTIECVIPQKHHRNVMGAKGHKVQGITSEFDVQVKFPDRDSYDPSQVNGDVDPDQVKPCDIITITGKEDNCLRAKQALLDLVPISINVDVPYDLHRSIIGQKGRGVKELMGRFDVHIELSPPEVKEDVIKITGAPHNVQDAKEALMERVAELEADRRDRELRSFSLKMEVNPDYHPKIIGRKGAVITKIKEEHEVQINLPRKGDPEEHIITITGYQHKAEAARDAIMKIVNDLNDIYREEVEIDSRVHSRLIGSRGRSIHKIMDDYKVEIKFPRSEDSNPNLVVISGDEDNVIEARDHLLNLEEEYLQDYEEQAERSQSHTLNIHFENVGGSQSHRGHSRNEPNGFVVQGGPWEQRAPNTNSVTEFPSFGRNAEEPRQTPVAGAWGSRR